MLHSHHYDLFPEFFHYLQQELYLLKNDPSSSPPQPLVISILLSFSMYLTLLGNSHECNHTVSGLPRLLYFTEYNAAKFFQVVVSQDVLSQAN